MFKKLFKKLFLSSKETLSFKQGFDLTNLPLVTLYQGEKRFNFLLDTGSSDSLINKGIISQIEHEMEEKTAELIGIEGNKQNADVCILTLSYKTQKYTFPFLVYDMQKSFDHLKKEYGVNIHGIIGAKFFNAFKYVLDFDELIAYSKK